MFRRFPVILFLMTLASLGALPPDPAELVREGRRFAEEKASRAGIWRTYLDRDVASMENYDVLAYDLKVRIEPDSTGDYGLSGTNRITLRAVGNDVDTLIFDCAHTMHVESVSIDGALHDFARQDDLLQVFLPQVIQDGDSITVAIDYNTEAVHDDNYGGGLYSTVHGTTPLIYTTVEPFASRFWWPCKDHPSDKADRLDLTVTCPAEYRVAGNGTLLSDTTQGDTRTFHWRESYPIATYLVFLAMTDYEIYEQNYTDGRAVSMPVVHYVFPEQYEQSVGLFSVTPSIIDTLAGIFGPYPFSEEKYGHCVVVNMNGAMEHQTCTMIGTTLMSPNYEWVVAHELAHQWCGDMITCADWSQIWLNEGTAKYAEALYYETLAGHSYYQSYLNDLDDGIRIDDKLRRDPDAMADEVLDWVVYAKGAWTWHMLRSVMGDAKFFRLLKEYFADPELRYGTATTFSLSLHASRIMGRDLGWFFDQWFNQSGRPEYTYAVYRPDSGDDFEVGLLSEGSEGTTFDMPVPILVNGEPDTLFAQGGITHARLTGDPATLTWDPDNDILDYGYTVQEPRLIEIRATRGPEVAVILPRWFDTACSGFHVYRSPINGGEWTRLTGSPASGEAYFDSTATAGASYRYRVAAVCVRDGVEYRTNYSNTLELTTAEMPHDLGLLLVDATSQPPNYIFPTDSALDAFYERLLSGCGHDTWDIETQGQPTLSDLGRYRMVIWVDENWNIVQLDGQGYNFKSYLASGGKFLLVGWRALECISEDLSAALHCDPIIGILAPLFQGGYGNLGYPDLEVDPSRITVESWDGALFGACTLGNDDESEILYRFHTSDGSQVADRKPCGVMIRDKAVVLGFPLYYMKENQSMAFMDKLLHDFGMLETETVPERVALSNSPNPFRGETVLRYDLPDPARVRITIYNILGQPIRSLIDLSMPAGRHTLTWDGCDDQGRSVSSGVYLCRFGLDGDRDVKVRKVVRVK